MAGGVQPINPLLYALPGVVAGYLLCMFMGGGGASGTPVPRKKKPAAQWAGPAPPPGAQLKLVLVVRADLGMSVGKTAAQCAHAAVGIVAKLRRNRGALLAAWEECGQTKVCLKCDGIEDLTALAKAAQAAGLPCEVIQDAGRTEVEPGTHTVLAIGPGTLGEIDAITGKLKLLR
jgi:PTH2 family peptidyl-tRNA hydrolase